MNALNGARDYTARGIEVFPLRGKMPAISTEDGGHGLHDATTDDDQLVAWFAAPPTGAGYTNVGLAIPENVIVMDVDTQHGGDKIFKEWVAEHGRGWVARAPRQRTGNGGIHAWFWHDGPGLRYKHPDFHGIELGRVGRYVIGEPSIHPNGNEYRWEVPLPAHISELATRPGLPVWLIEAFAEPEVNITVRSRAYEGDDPLNRAAHEFTSWSRILGEHGWKLVRNDGDSDGSVWRHPNATGKQSATIKHACLFVYSPNTPFPETTYNDPHGVTLYRAYSTLEHAGDYSRATRVLRENGYLDDINPAIASLRDLVIAPTVISASSGDDDSAHAHESKLGARIDWPVFWRQEEDLDSRWLSEPIVAEGRAHALFAGAKTGKSLLMLQLVAALATGREFLDKPEHDPVGVLYADYEMTEDDLRQRLTQFGYGPGDGLDPLHYYLLGAGQPLDTMDGGTALIETAHDAGVRLVVIDTTARAVGGAENDADTLRAFYRCSGVGLKRQGIAWVRVDHSGKDATKGQRGTSAKNDDVDVVWRLTASGGDACFVLEATHQRMGWVPRRVELQLNELAGGGIAWAPRGARTYSNDAKQLALQLDELGVALNASYRTAESALKEASRRFNKTHVGDALRWRVERASADVFDGVGSR